MRLFVAVWPSAEVVEGLQDLVRPEVDGVRWTTADQWHVTARFLGRLDGPGEVSARLRSVPLPAAAATIGPASESRTPGVLWLPVAGLDALAAEVIRLTADLGEPVDHAFQGHLTLARSRRSTPRGALGGRGDHGRRQHSRGRRFPLRGGGPDPVGCLISNVRSI